MTDTIRIKRRLATGGAGAPSTLSAAELAYNEASHILYYGEGNSGGAATSIVRAAGSGYLAAPDPIGSGTANSGAFTTLGATGSVTLNTTTGSWSAFNWGKQLLVTTTGYASNPTIGISDYTGSNWWAINNSSGTLYLSAMPALSNSTAAPVNALTVNSSGINGRIGATTPAGGAFTTLSASTSLTLGGAAVATQTWVTSQGYVTTPYSLPTASTTVLGGVKVDGTTVTIASGVISSAGQTAAQVVAAIAAGNPGSFSTLVASGTVSGTGFTALLAPYAPLASPALTGMPTAPTAAASTNTTQLATTAFVIGQTGAQATVTPQQFGAKGDGVTDDTTAWRNAVTALGSVGGTVVVPMPPVSYLLSGEITLPAKVSIVGDVTKSLINTAAGTYTLFSIAGSHVSIKNLSIENLNKTGGKDISIDTTSANGPGNGYAHLYIENILSDNSYGVIGDSGSGQGLYQDCIIKRVWATSARGIGFSFTRSFGSLVVEDCTAGWGASSASFAMFAIDNSVLTTAGVGAVGGATFSRCFALGSDTFTHASQVGFSIYNTVAVWMNDCDADSCDFAGMLFSNVANAYIINSSCSCGTGYGIYFTGCLACQVSNMYISGLNFLSGGPGLGADGVAGLGLGGGNSEMSFVGLDIATCGGAGISIVQQNGPINFSGGFVRACSGPGILCTGTQAVLVTGMTLVGNGCNYSFGTSAAPQFLRGVMLNSGGVVNAGPAPISA
jgi:Pectate lyase superfamily protein